jgi:hypothetical protein
MGKVADIKLKWKRSASADAKRAVLTVNNDGDTSTVDIPIEQEEFLLVVKANKSFGFSIETFDDEGLSSNSLSYSSTLGDLTAPQPATELGHEVVAIRDVPDEPAPPPPPGEGGVGSTRRGAFK